MRPKALDLFCCAGGAGMGLHRAGFDVVGVDIDPQPRYPFEFHHADAMAFRLDGFDFIWASPPCQQFCALRTREDLSGYPDLIDPIRQRLIASGKPFVIENVPGAPVRGGFITITGDVGVYCGPEAMGIDWMSGNEMSEAIPPAYSEYIGRVAMKVVNRRQSSRKETCTVTS